MPPMVLANAWQDLWLNKNQQGMNLLKQNKNDEAAQVFSDHNWRAIAYYKDKKYQEAYNEFKKDNSARGLYNQGNALAQLQKYPEAIDAYNKSLELQKNSPDATYNKELVEKLLKQQQNQKNADNKQDKSEQDNKQQNQQSSNSKQNKSEQKQQSADNKQNNSGQDNPPQNSENKQNNSEQDNKQQNSNNKQNTQAQGNKQQNTQPDKEPEQSSPNSVENNKQPSGKEQDKAKQTATANNEQNSQLAGNEKSETPVTASRSNYTKKQTPIDIEVKSELSKIPDDPGGLLRNKFLRDYQKQGDSNE